MMKESQTESLTEQQASALSTAPLHRLAVGFWASNTLAAAIELQLFTKLSGKEVNTESLSQLLQVPTRPADMLLTACAALGLLEKRNGFYYNSPSAEEFLVKGKPYYFGNYVTMVHRRLYEPWRRLTEAIRTNKQQVWSGDTFEEIAGDPEAQTHFTEAMHSLSIFRAKAVFDTYDLSGYQHLLDIGGASGAYCIEVCRKHPHLHATVFDREPALTTAREKVAEANLCDRIDTRAGDFFKQDLPKGSDVILLSHILHDWSAEQNRFILDKCFAALPSGGLLMVCEIMMDDQKTGPELAALLSLNMLIATEGGCNYTWSEYAASLEAARFRKIKRVTVPLSGGLGMLLGRKP
jgi:3-hydroxy-5-methyl-1-naphthoate 3-O-methyltransferase